MDFKSSELLSKKMWNSGSGAGVILLISLQYENLFTIQNNLTDVKQVLLKN